MLKRLNWRFAFAALLLFCSVVFYILHYSIFRDPHHIFIFLIGDIAFVFIHVLLVTLILDQLLRNREKAIILNKLNMIISAFYSEVGTRLLKVLAANDAQACEVRNELLAVEDWTKERFFQINGRLQSYGFNVQIGLADLAGLKNYLIQKRSFLVQLLVNPYLYEHKSFTGLLWAILHLTEEMEARDNLDNLPPKDYEHINHNINRVYSMLATQWLEYMCHLSAAYPFLFSYQMRNNPFCERHPDTFTNDLDDFAQEPLLT